MSKPAIAEDDLRAAQKWWQENDLAEVLDAYEEGTLVASLAEAFARHRSEPRGDKADG